MPTIITSTTWPIKPHTKAKHEILRRYLGAWFPILSSWHGRIIYMDAFCGPGEYEQGEPGSPLIALGVAENVAARGPLANEVIFWFVDEDKSRVDHLDALLKNRQANKPFPANFRIGIYPEQFHEFLSRRLDWLESNNLSIAPTFAFIDPFGFSGVPMNLIHRLLSHSRTEAFITFMVDSVNRFVNHPDPQVRNHIVELFGTAEVQDVVRRTGDRFQNLRALYQRQLMNRAQYVRYFHMRDRHDTPIYDLFFAGNNDLGFVKMKEAMWRVDPGGQFTFSDATNPSQLVLFTEDHTTPLATLILMKFQGRANVPIAQVRSWVEGQTIYLKTHMDAALTYAEANQRIHVHNTKANGKRRRKKTFPDDALVDFT